MTQAGFMPGDDLLQQLRASTAGLPPRSAQLPAQQPWQPRPQPQPQPGPGLQLHEQPGALEVQLQGVSAPGVRMLQTSATQQQQQQQLSEPVTTPRAGDAAAAGDASRNSIVQPAAAGEPRQQQQGTSTAELLQQAAPVGNWWRDAARARPATSQGAAACLNRYPGSLAAAEGSGSSAASRTPARAAAPAGSDSGHSRALGADAGVNPGRCACCESAAGASASAAPPTGSCHCRPAGSAAAGSWGRRRKAAGWTDAGGCCRRLNCRPSGAAEGGACSVAAGGRSPQAARRAPPGTGRACHLAAGSSRSSGTCRRQRGCDWPAAAAAAAGPSRECHPPAGSGSSSCRTAGIRPACRAAEGSVLPVAAAAATAGISYCGRSSGCRIPGAYSRGKKYRRAADAVAPAAEVQQLRRPSLAAHLAERWRPVGRRRP